MNKLVNSPEELSQVFWSRVKKGRGCWKWLGSIRWDGYGQFPFRGRTYPAHRVAWILCKGEIPGDLPLDHLCRDRSCVNPDHLEPVTHRTNILRGTGASARCARKRRCVRGHLLSGKNMVINKKGWRCCVKCRAIRRHALWVKNLEKNRAKAREVYLKNREKCLARVKTYYQKNRDRILVSAHKHYQKIRTARMGQRQ